MMNKAKTKLLTNQKSWGEAKVKLKTIPGIKGAGLFASVDIKEGETIAYYPVVLIEDPGEKTRNALRNYFIEVKYLKKQIALVGKPDLKAAIKPPTRKIPHSGLWSNEPFPKEKPNAEMQGRTLKTKPKVGDKLSYSLKATRNIRKGDEILWCYGSQFDRGKPPYKTGCNYRKSQQ